MIDSIRFVANAAPRKAFDPTLLFFRIENNRIWSFNGSVSLSAPFEMDGPLYPHSSDLLRAVTACVGSNQPIHLTLDEANHLIRVRCGRFSAKVRCNLEAAGNDDPERYLPPKGKVVKVKGDLVGICQTLEPFVGTDASRPWACGIYLEKHSAFATNNIIAIEHWMKEAWPFPVVIPIGAVEELIRLKEAPTRVQVDQDRITFFFSGDRWMTAVLLALEWPDLRSRLDEVLTGADLVPVEPTLFSDVEKLLPFSDSVCHQIWFGEGRIAVQEEAATLDNPQAPAAGSYNGKQLLSLARIVKRADFNLYPRSLVFVGDNVRGMMAGMR